MTKIIIDTNIVFSIFLNINSRIGQVQINGSKFYDFYAPEFLRHEILEHKEKIKSLAKLSDNDFLEIYELVMRNITVLHHTLLPIKIIEKAKDLCKYIDIDDTAFIAVQSSLEENYGQEI